MHKYCIVNNFTGDEYFAIATAEEISEFEWFWSILGWKVIKID